MISKLSKIEQINCSDLAKSKPNSQNFWKLDTLHRGSSRHHEASANSGTSHQKMCSACRLKVEKPVSRCVAIFGWDIH